MLFFLQPLRCSMVYVAGEAPFGHQSTSRNLQADNKSMSGGVTRPEIYNHIGRSPTAAGNPTVFLLAVRVRRW